MVKKMAQLMSVKKITKVMLLVFACFLVSFFFFFNHYAAPATPSDLTKELTQTEIEEIQEFQDLQEMVSQIFEIRTEMGTEDLSDPIKLMFSLVSRILEYWDKEFVKSTLYHLLVGLALVFLVANFSIKMYEESSAGLDLKIDSNLMLKKYVQFIFAILMIYNLKGIVYFILGFFRFVLKLCMNVTDANFIGTPENIDVLNPKRVAYEILKQHNIIKQNTLLDDVIARSKESSLRAQYMMPWVFSWIGKLALIVVIFINSIKLFVHSAFYMVSLGDFIGDLKRSKFVEYTKNLIALVLEEAVIVVVLYLSNLLLNPYLQDLLKNGVETGNLSFLTLAMIYTGVSMSKVFVIIGSSHISKKIVGVA